MMSVEMSFTDDIPYINIVTALMFACGEGGNISKVLGDVRHFLDSGFSPRP